MLSTAITAGAQDIQLPAPDTAQPSLSVVEALATRHSVREYSDEELSLQEISNLCWAACGRARDEEHITAPSAMNRQEIRLYVFSKDGAYEYSAGENKLLLAAPGDNRRLVAGFQDFAATAPVSLVMVADYEKFGADDEHARTLCAVDAGIVSENVNIYCQGAGLATVPRATMDAGAISALLGLSAGQVPLMNNPVGRPK